MKDLQELELIDQKVPEDTVFSCCQCRRLQRRRRIIVVYMFKRPIGSIYVISQHC